MRRVINSRKQSWVVGVFVDVPAQVGSRRNFTTAIDTVVYNLWHNNYIMLKLLFPISLSFAFAQNNLLHRCASSLSPHCLLLCLRFSSFIWISWDIISPKQFNSTLVLSFCVRDVLSVYLSVDYLLFLILFHDRLRFPFFFCFNLFICR